jgi:polar amino acid transport system permease protein
MTLYFNDLLPYTSVLLKGLWISLYVTLLTMFVGGALGIILYRGKTGNVKVLRYLSSGYIELFRNTPLLVQLYLVYFGLPQYGINFNATWSGLIALSLNNAAYTAEIYRAGFESVPQGLREAGSALGMQPRQIFRHVLFLPAIRNVFPALTNQLILLFLASSILSIIALPELMDVVMAISSETFRTVEVLAVGGLLYFGVSALLAISSRLAEARLFKWAVNTNV